MNKQDSTFAGKRTDMPENSISAASSAAYLTPEVCVCAFAPENGFAGSILNYNTASAITDMLEVKSEWNTNGEGESFF